MFAYHLRLALKSLRRTPVLTALMIGAIGLGVGVCITTLTVYRLMSSNPIAASQRRALLGDARQLGSEHSRGSTISPELPPPKLTYRDAMAMFESDIPTRKVVMRKAAFVVEAPPKTRRRSRF